MLIAVLSMAEINVIVYAGSKIAVDEVVVVFAPAVCPDKLDGVLIVRSNPCRTVKPN